jgi:vacuolar protein sorting-associated protein VTA1
MAKYAASSLGFEDVPNAVKYLTEALKLLTQPPPQR